MKKFNFILKSIGALFFLGFIGLNLTISQSFQEKGAVQLTVTELAAKAVVCSGERCPTGYNSQGGDKPGEVICCATTLFGTGKYN